MLKKKDIQQQNDLLIKELQLLKIEEQPSIRMAKAINTRFKFLLDKRESNVETFVNILSSMSDEDRKDLIELFTELDKVKGVEEIMAIKLAIAEIISDN